MMKNAAVAEIIIVARIKIRVVVSRVVSCWIAEAVPVLALLIMYNVMKDIAITRVLMLPRRMRNCFGFSFIEADEMIAAWDAPSPGRKDAIGEMIVITSY